MTGVIGAAGATPFIRCLGSPGAQETLHVIGACRVWVKQARILQFLYDLLSLECIFMPDRMGINGTALGHLVSVQPCTIRSAQGFLQLIFELCAAEASIFTRRCPPIGREFTCVSFVYLNYERSLLSSVSWA